MRLVVRVRIQEDIGRVFTHFIIPRYKCFGVAPSRAGQVVSSQFVRQAVGLIERA